MPVLVNLAKIHCTALKYRLLSIQLFIDAVATMALTPLTLFQLSRNTEKRLILSNLRESGSLAQDADCIVFPWLGEYYHTPSTATAPPPPTPSCSTWPSTVAGRRMRW